MKYYTNLTILKTTIIFAIYREKKTTQVQQFLFMKTMMSADSIKRNLSDVNRGTISLYCGITTNYDNSLAIFLLSDQKSLGLLLINQSISKTKKSVESDQMIYLIDEQACARSQKCNGNFVKHKLLQHL